jgi:hypothetical protein
MICAFYKEIAIGEEEEIKDGCRISELKCPWRNPEHYKSCGRWRVHQSIRKRCFQRFRMIRIGD